jgi:hypothetical protein
LSSAWTWTKADSEDGHSSGNRRALASSLSVRTRLALLIEELDDAAAM